MTFYIGFGLVVIGIIMTIKKTIKTHNIISPQIILMVGLLVYLYLPAVVLQSKFIDDSSYNLVILVGVIGAYFASNCFAYNIVDDSNVVTKTNLPKGIYFEIGAYIYVLYMFFQIIQAIVNAGGIIAAFRVNRLEAYLSGDMVSDSMVINFVKEGLKIFFYFYFAMLYERGKKIKAILLFIIPMIHHRFTAVTRYDFIAMAASLIIYLMYANEKKNIIIVNSEIMEGTEKRKKIKAMRLIVIGLLGIYLALLFLRIANFTRYGNKVSDLSFSFNALFKSTLANDSLYYEFLYSLYNAFSQKQVGFEYGLSWFAYPVINFIPRSLWPGKPYTAFSARFTDKIFWSLTSGKPVVTFSIIGEGYAQFGYLGAFICPFVFLGSRWLNFISIKKIRYNQMYMLIMVLSLVTYMRSEAPIFYTIIDGVWLWIIRKTCTQCIKS